MIKPSCSTPSAAGTADATDTKAITPPPAQTVLAATPATEGPRATRFQLDGQEYAVLSFPVESAASMPNLTNAEKEVLTFVLAGLSNRDIATRRRCSERTVANHVQSIFRKVGVTSRAELVRMMLER